MWRPPHSVRGGVGARLLALTPEELSMTPCDHGNHVFCVDECGCTCHDGDCD
ncbi:hypothetical protein ACI79C_08155 [Geodermatophilus sp. SYSU D00697]